MLGITAKGYPIRGVINDTSRTKRIIGLKPW